MIPSNFEFYYVAGNGLMMRFRDQTHPTAFMSSNWYTFFADLDGEHVKSLDPKETFADTGETIWDICVRYFNMHYAISWNWFAFQNREQYKAHELEVEMLNYHDVIRDVYEKYCIQEKNYVAGMRIATRELWFLGDGGVCTCGHTRVRHRGKCFGCQVDNGCECEYFNPDHKRMLSGFEPSKYSVCKRTMRTMLAKYVEAS